MTSHRFSLSLGHSSARAGIGLLILLGVAVAAVSAACGSDDIETNNFIGDNDAGPPRLGPKPDGGQ